LVNKLSLFVHAIEPLNFPELSHYSNILRRNSEYSELSDKVAMMVERKAVKKADLLNRLH